MEMNFYNISIIILLFSNYSCNTSEIDSIRTYSISQLNKNSPVANIKDFKPLNIHPHLGDPGKFIIIDSLLIVDDRDSASQITIFNLNNLSNPIKLINYGKGPNEYLVISEIKHYSSDSILLLFDLTVQKLNGYKLNNLINNENDLQPISYVPPPFWGTSIEPLNDSIMIFTSLQGLRVGLYNIINGKLIVNAGNRPKEQYFNTTLVQDKYQSSLNNQALLQYDERSNILYLVYSRKPLIETYHLDSDHLTEIRLLSSINFINKNISLKWNHLSKSYFIDSQIYEENLVAFYADELENFFLVSINPEGEIVKSIRFEGIKNPISFNIDRKSKTLYLLCENESLNFDILTFNLKNLSSNSQFYKQGE